MSNHMWDLIIIKLMKQGRGWNEGKRKATQVALFELTVS